MRALRLSGARDVSVVDVDDPAPGAGEVLVRIRACGVCGSDLNAWRGVPGIQYPLPPGAPGHEAFGEVVALGPGVTNLRLGDSVTGLMFNAYAQLGVARADQVVRLSQGSPILGEPLACAMNVVRRSAIKRGDRVAIVGFGYLASLIVQLFPTDLEAWVALSKRDDSRQLARRLGADAAYDLSEVPADLWDSFPVVIEAAGVQRTLDLATWLTAYAGHLVIAGYHADGPRSVNLQSWNWKGIDVINAHERDPARYVSGLREALELVQVRDLNPGSLISHTWPLKRAADALRTAEERPTGFVKAVLEP